MKTGDTVGVTYFENRKASRIVAAINGSFGPTIRADHFDTLDEKPWYALVLIRNVTRAELKTLETAVEWFVNGLNAGGW
jgi:hypothetical protein